MFKTNWLFIYSILITIVEISLIPILAILILMFPWLLLIIAVIFTVSAIIYAIYTESKQRYEKLLKKMDNQDKY